MCIRIFTCNSFSPGVGFCPPASGVQPILVWWGTAAFVSVPSPGLYSREQDIFCLEFEQSLHVCLTCGMPSLFDPPSTALVKRFDGSDHKTELFSLFPCQSSLLLTAAEQPSSGHSLHSQTAGTLAVSGKY